MSSSPTVAVIGAGISGITCAAALRDKGIEVCVFDKSRGVGGRMATRRVAPWQWDHGAQYFTAETAEFRKLLNPLPTWEQSADTTWHVGEPSQNQLVKMIASDIAPVLQTPIVKLSEHGSGQWQLQAEDSTRHGPFDALALAVPSVQAEQLLPQAHAFNELSQVEMVPCWALMIATPEPVEVPPAVDEPHQNISWLAADHTKPGRSRNYGQYVAHATARWSEEHLENSREQAQEQLLAFFQEIVGGVEISYATAHRWRYAFTRKPLGKPCLLDDASRIGLCGDWCLGSRAEHGYLSGLALGESIALRFK